MSADTSSANAWLIRWLWMLLGTGMVCWGGPVWPAYVAWARANESVQRMEQLEMQAHGPEAAEQATPAGEEKTAQAAPTSEMALLTQWHALLRQHHLTGWQGRLGVVAPGTSAESGQAPAGLGPVWRLEGPATYGQGVALLQSLAQAMRGVVLTQVQARHRPDSPWLEWSLQWQSSVGPPAQRWGVRWPSMQGVTGDPFAADRLWTAGREPSTPMTALEMTDLVWPQVSLRDLRLAGVLLSPSSSQALIVSFAPRREASPEVGHAISAQPTWRSLRVGQRLGQERARVLAIEPRRVMLQASGQSAELQGGQADTPVVLELAAWSPSPSNGGQP